MRYDGKEAPGQRSRPRLREREGPAVSAVGGIGPKARTEQQVIGLPGIELFLPVVVGVHVSRGQDFSALEDVHAAKETGCFFLLSCGELLSLYS